MWDKVVSFFSGGVVKEIGDAIDSVVTSDEERLELKNALQTINNNATIRLKELEGEYDKQVTKRWESDNEHSITRLVRPSIVIWTYVVFTLILFADGNIGEFSIKDAYIPLIETVLVTVTIAYFGSRGIEKTSKMINGIRK